MLYESIARGWENLVDRLGGPMSFRFLMQPAVAIFFAVRAGVNDARENKPTFLGCALSNPRSWSPRMRQSWKDVGKCQNPRELGGTRPTRCKCAAFYGTSPEIIASPGEADCGKLIRVIMSVLTP